MIPALRLHPDDDVAVLLEHAPVGSVVLSVNVRDAIDAGHKVALHDINHGATVRKYGQSIGVATQPIRAGDHVHSHNLSVGQGSASPSAAGGSRPARHQPGGMTFQGYRRADGRVGTRNYIGVIASVNCSATVVRRIARHFEDRDLPGIDGVVPITHSSGCGMSKTGEGIDVLERTLTGYAANPNFAAVLMIGLGCEVAQAGEMVERHGLVPGERLRLLTIQEAGGTAAAITAGIDIFQDLIAVAATDRREAVSASELVLGLQCGGSDGWSGVTANPALGVAADLLVAEGATVLLSETPEISGAEHLLLERATTPAVAAALRARLDWWEAYAARNGASLDNNPSPGNKAGGLTTIYEKSLGAVAKAGTSPLNDVTLYAQRSAARGLVFMDSPGYDPCSATGQVAAGANLLAFTTGRGSVFGAKPTPCLKIASNAELARRMADDMDVDASPILTGIPIETIGREIVGSLLAVASGRPTKSEGLGVGDHEFVPWQLGAWM
ncbi:altronate hydrolase [Sphingomonas gellani]|uniref:Altronate hydrolase n=1 Tax=Sphingomonas gellani TaxID=1166340 RepID=A0A1H8DVM9_9SPHN|nr:altronate dehydratase family protein [Sphingomonas gellani]SEN11263.1 altronate hydrolase [Sphingomonas gellani]